MSREIKWGTPGYWSVTVYGLDAAPLSGVRAVQLDTRTATLAGRGMVAGVRKPDTAGVPIDRLTVDAKFVPEWRALFGEMPEWVVGVSE